MTDFSKPGTFTGTHDMFGSPVNVGDYIDCMVSHGAEVKELYGEVVVHPVLGESYFAVECGDSKLLENYPLSDVFNISKRPDNITADLQVTSWTCPVPKRGDSYFGEIPLQVRTGRYSYSGIDRKGNKITLDIETKQILKRNITIEIKLKEQK